MPVSLRQLLLSLSSLSVLILLSNNANAQSPDLVPRYSVPLYSSADSCIQTVLDDDYGYEVVDQDCDFDGPYSCFCKDPAHSSTRTYELSMRAVAACSSAAAGGSAVSAFNQYCSLNAAGLTGPSSPTATAGNGE